MSKERLLSLSDGVFASISTIRILELAPPEGSTIAALKTLLPKNP